MSAADEDLVKVHIDLGDNPDAGGEAVFAKAHLGSGSAALIGRGRS
jgi:hypothetical protein